MASVDGYTTAKLDELLGAMVVDVAADNNGQLIFTRANGEEVNSGSIVNPSLAVEAAYPVGSIYIATVPTNPSALLGIGTWIRFGQGRTIISQSSSDNDFNEPEEVGGEKTVALTAANHAPHTHSIDHDHPSFTISGGDHNHTVPRSANAGNVTPNFAAAGAGATSVDPTLNSGAHTHNVDVPNYVGTSGSQGSGTPHNNMPPYIVAYVWKRIA